MAPTTFVLLTLFMALTGYAQAVPNSMGIAVRQAECSPENPDSNSTRFVEGLIGEGLADPSAGVTLAGIVRLAFHDCFPDKCDGSIRFEFDRPANTRVAATAGTFLASIADREDTCLSFADTIQVALRIAMSRSGGPAVQFVLGRKDADSEGPRDDQLPLAGDSFDSILALYAARGFVPNGDVRMMVASQCGGHALGAFAGGNLNFTPNPDVFDNAYAKNLVALKDSGTALPGHFTLPSDRLLIDNDDTLAIVREYADELVGLRNLSRDFGQYLVQQSQL